MEPISALLSQFTASGFYLFVPQIQRLTWLRFRPQEIGLTVWVNLGEAGVKDLYPITALNETVSVVEPASSWFDPGLLFLYLVFGVLLAGGGYAAYQAFMVPRGKKGNKVRVKRAVVPAKTEKKSYPDVKPYEEEWIPEHHLKTRASKLKMKEGTTSAGEELTSGGEVTSGGESGPDAKARRRKGKKA